MYLLIWRLSRKRVAHVGAKLPRADDGSHASRGPAIPIRGVASCGQLPSWQETIDANQSFQQSHSLPGLRRGCRTPCPVSRIDQEPPVALRLLVVPHSSQGESCEQLGPGHWMSTSGEPNAA